MTLDRINDLDLQLASCVGDFDMATAYLQRVGNIPDAGVAAIYFRDETFDWDTASFEERELRLRGWLKLEADCL